MMNGAILVSTMTHMPGVLETVKGFFGCEPGKGVNPNKTFSIQGGALVGNATGILLLNDTPLSISTWLY